MTTENKFHHVSVLPLAADWLVVNPDGTYIDCTLGGGGHSARIAAFLSKKGHLIGIDQDESAIQAARYRLQKAATICRLDFVRDNFSNLSNIIESFDLSPTGTIDGIIFDLGVSSHQIDTADRGFSYIHDAPLDMRMDQRQMLSAKEIINEWDEKELERIFFAYGEERWSKRIAEFIATKRQEKNIKTTGELVSIIEKAIPKAVRRETKGHPAKRIFQAVRIAVNDELGILPKAIEAAIRALKPAGRLAIITFHSLEDRIVKDTLKLAATDCLCPPRLPVCICGHQAAIKVIGKAQRPTEEEITENSRATGAKLRRAEKLNLMTRQNLDKGISRSRKDKNGS